MIKNKLIYATAFFLSATLSNCSKQNENSFKTESHVSDSVKSIRKAISNFNFKANPAVGNILISGDSTIAEQYDGTDIEKLFFTKGSVKSIAVPGESIEQQFTHFVHLDKKIKEKTTLFIIQIGLNNIEPYIKGKASLESTLDVMQIYIDKVKKDCPNAKIIVAAMIPCYQRLIDIFEADANKAQKFWSNLNNNFAKLKNIDLYVDDHIKILSDGNNNLDPIYEAINPDNDKPDGIHENNDARKVIAYYWLKAIKTL